MKRKNVLAILSVILMMCFMTGCGKTEVGNVSEEVTSVEVTEVETIEVESTVEETIEVESTVEETTEEVTTEEETTEVETVVEENTVAETEAAEVALEVEYTYMDFEKVMYAQKSVNVRSLPSTDGDKLGGLSTNDEVNVTGQCNETKWYRIAYKDGVAYVSDSYLGENKVEVQEQAAGNAGSSSAGEYTVPYMQNDGGTWYASSDGMNCDFYSNRMGSMVKDICYTVEGLKAAYPNLGQVIYNEDGSIKILCCGCCGDTYGNYGIPSYLEAQKTAGDLGYQYNRIEQVKKNWVGTVPNTYTHNITWYYFTK